MENWQEHKLLYITQSKGNFGWETFWTKSLFFNDLDQFQKLLYSTYYGYIYIVPTEVFPKN